MQPPTLIILYHERGGQARKHISIFKLWPSVTVEDCYSAWKKESLSILMNFLHHKKNCDKISYCWHLHLFGLAQFTYSQAKVDTLS